MADEVQEKVVARVANGPGGFVPDHNLEWVDISNEAERTYVWDDGYEYTIQDPTMVACKRDMDGDSHRVIDHDGRSHYIKAGWRVIRWTLD